MHRDEEAPFQLTESCSVLRPFSLLRKGVFMYSCGELLTRGLNSGKRKHPLFFLEPPSPPRFTGLANGKIDYGSLKASLGKCRPRLSQDSYEIRRADRGALAATGKWQDKSFEETLLQRWLVGCILTESHSAQGCIKMCDGSMNCAMFLAGSLNSLQPTMNKIQILFFFCINVG